MQKRISIENMSCMHCVKHVTSALQDVKGVLKVQVSLANKNAIVEVSQETNDQDLKDAVIEAGYDVVKIENL